MTLPLSWLEAETAPRWRPNVWRGTCPHCGRVHRFAHEGRKQCNGQDFVAITPATFGAVLKHHQGNRQ